MNSIRKLARSAVLELRPYVSARSLNGTGRILLDANESSDAYGENGLNLHRYPSPQPMELVQRLAELYGVSPQELVVCRGSDEAIELLVRTFCEAGRDRILIAPPTYGVYKIAAEIQGVETLEVPLIANGNTFRLDEQGIIAGATRIENRVKIVFLCSPNNPTGTAFLPETLERIVSSIGDAAIVVIDEAYAEWSAFRSMLEVRSKWPNLILLRTLSKAWACAGARCGVAIGDPEAIELLNRVRAPYPISTPAAEAALRATEPLAARRMNDRVLRTRAEKDRIAQSLASLPSVVRTYLSEGNFILVECADRLKILTEAQVKGIYLRDRDSEPGLRNCIRITVGSSAENEEVLGIFRRAVR